MPGLTLIEVALDEAMEEIVARQWCFGLTVHVGSGIDPTRQKWIDWMAPSFSANVSASGCHAAVGLSRPSPLRRLP